MAFLKINTAGMNKRYGRSEPVQKAQQVTSFNTPSKNRAPNIPKTEAKEGDVLSFFDERKGKVLTSFDGGYQVASATKVSDKEKVETGSVITDSIKSRLGITIGKSLTVKTKKPAIELLSDANEHCYLFATNGSGRGTAFDPVENDDNDDGNADLIIKADDDIWLETGHGVGNGGVYLDWPSRRINAEGNYFYPTGQALIDLGKSADYWGNIYMKGTVSCQSGDMTVASVGDIIIDADDDVEINANGGDITFKDAAATLASINSSGDFTANGSVTSTTTMTVGTTLKVTGAGATDAACIQIANQADLGIWKPASNEIGFTTNDEDSFRMSTDTFYSGYDNAVDLGKSDKRWDDIYATNGTIQTSDSRLKESIEDSALGLSFVNSLRPVSFKFKDKTRKHYGLVAQEVEKVLSDNSISTTDFAPLIHNSDSDRYGMRYTEFVSILIKAVQDLSKEVEELKKQ